jgi:predicted secreted protein with PEFG-CTERM motif
MAIALMALSLISMTSMQQDAFAQSLGMSITATADRNSDTITVTGKTVSDITDVTFRVTSPSGLNVVAIWQASPDDNGEFMVKFIVGPTWTENGFYEITAMQSVTSNSLYTLNVLVEVNDGMTAETNVSESNLDAAFEPNMLNVAKDAGLVLYEASFVNGDNRFTVTGTTDRVSEAVVIQVFAPNGNLVTTAQLAATLDGEFTAEIVVGGSLWKQDGFYTVTAYQNENPNYSDSIEVDILDGTVVPEFGTIAAMILAVAIISIIAISSKSRLSIIPRF